MEIFLLLFLWIIPFIVGILLPSFIIPWIVNLVTRSKVGFEALTIYSFLIAVSAFFANLAWDRYVFNVVYYEWDRISIPFTLFFHEAPVDDPVSGSVMLRGLTLNHLTSIWLMFDLAVVFLPFVITLLMFKKQKNFNKIRNVLAISSITLVLSGFLVNVGPWFLKLLLLNPLFLILY